MRRALLPTCIWMVLQWGAFSVSQAAVTQVKVKKVKGHSAIVNFKGNVIEGEDYILVPKDQDINDMKTGPRLKRLGVTLDFSSLKTKTSTIESSSTNFSLLIDFGWNMKSYEIGPILGFSSANTGFGGTTTSTTAGLFFDYNFEANIEPVSYLFGAGLRPTYTMINPPSGTALSSMTTYVNIFWKWFAFGHSTAFKWDVGYYFENTKTSASAEQNSTGFKSTAALLMYY